MMADRVGGCWRQEAYRLRCDWGLAGAEAITAGADVAVVIDVLSFTTTLSVALDAGTVVLPYRWKDDSAAAYAAARDAVLATARSATDPGRITLSPASIRTAPPVARLVLPSPNGSTIAHRLAGGGATVLGASLRNADAVAAWITGQHDPARATVAVIAAGEHWPDGGLRPAIEDLWGAGAVLGALHDRGWRAASPEAELAHAAFASIGDTPGERLRACASGRELIELHGFPDDVEIAAELNESRSVPILRDDRFVPAT
jgi:2-phosphosulfolactate phosphatase